MGDSSFEEELRAALSEQAWSAAIDSVETNWVALTQTNQALLLEVINTLPAEVLAENPRLVAAKTYVNYLPVSGDRRPLRFQHRVAPVPRGLLDILVDLTSRSVSARFQGNMAEAVALVREAHGMIADVSDEAIASIRPVLPDIRLQWAITLELGGELIDANRAYERTFDEALTFDNERIVTEAAGSLALNYALSGNRGVAEQWLSRQPGAGRETQDGPADAAAVDTVLTAGALARALLAVNDLRFDDAQEALDAAPSADIDRESWAFRLFVESALARASGQSQQQLARVGATLSTQPERLRSSGLNGWLSTMAVAELQMALGDVGSATQTIAQLDGVTLPTAIDPVRLVRAWAALRQGDAPGALVLAAPGLSQTLISPRVTVELLVLVAAAKLELGQIEEARGHFAAAIDLVASDKLGIVLLRLTAAEQATLLSMHRAALEPRMLRELDSRTSAVTAPPAVQLSERERVVFRHLVQRRSVAAIAAAEHLSPNTIKTQLKSIYRKLDVNDRDGAIRVATTAPHLLA